MRRTFKQRCDAIPDAIRRGDAFKSRLTECEGDARRCAAMMAEAIEMDRAARGLEVVRQDGLTVVCMEELQACYCMDAARDAYLRATGGAG